MEIQRLVNDFESLTLPSSKWTHTAHLRIALWYLYTEGSFYQALQKIKCGLIRYGTNKPASLCYSRYHETITTFWAYQIRELIIENHGKNLEEIESLMLKDKRLLDKSYILHFYPKKIFDSQKARSLFVASVTVRYFFWRYSRPTLKPAFVWLLILLIASSGLILQFFGYGFPYEISH